MQTYHPGTRIGQYEIASRPMMGGMGVVYFALDHGNDGRPVAIKTFRPEFLPNREARDRFLREGTAWIELGSHPHIVRCYEVKYIDPTAFLVLELIAKEQNMPDASLRSWLIPGRPLPIDQALLFALQIARGMQYATEKIPGFVHRDLKPENILVGADRLPGTNINRLRVTDFGLVKTIASGDIATIPSDVEDLKPNQVQFTRGAGTPLYMAPEQWKGEPVGGFTDVYAFGCILYEMLSGQSVAEGKTIKELQISHCYGRLRATPANLPKDIVRFVTKCLILNPIDRYRLWNEIIDDLGKAYTLYSRLSVPRTIVSADTNHEERVEVGWSYNEIGLAYGDVGNTEAAAVFLEKALLLAREARNRIGEWVVLNNLGNVYLNLGNAQRAIRYFEQVLVIHREIGGLTGEEAALSNLGNAYLSLGDAMRAIGYFKRALMIDRKSGDRHDEATSLGNLGAAYAALGELQQAIGYHEQALTIAHEIGDQRGEGADLGNLGCAYRELGDALRAIDYFEQHLKIAREIGDRRGEGNALGNLGNAYGDLRDPRRAIGYHEQALTIAREIGDRHGEGSELGNLGASYAELGEVSRALGYFKKRLEIAREIGDQRGEMNALGNLGTAYMELENARQAFKCYEHAIAIGREIGDLNSVATDLFNMALLFSQQRESARALPLAQEAARIWTQMGNLNAQHARQFVAQLLASQK